MGDGQPGQVGQLVDRIVNTRNVDPARVQLLQMGADSVHQGRMS